VLLAVQLPTFENSTATPPILGVPQPVPTNQLLAPIVTFPTVAVLKLFARVCTLVGSETVIELPFVLDHTNWVYDPVSAALNTFQAVSIADVGAVETVNACENVTPLAGTDEVVGVGVNVGVLVNVGVGVDVLVNVGVLVGVSVGVDVNVGVLVGVSVGLDVSVGVFVAVNVGVLVNVGVFVGVSVGVGVGVGVILIHEDQYPFESKYTLQSLPLLND
jgi:hypothetical protein